MDAPISVRRSDPRGPSEGLFAAIERLTGWSPAAVGCVLAMMLSIGLAGASLVLFRETPTTKPEFDFGGAPPWAQAAQPNLPGAITAPQPRRADSMRYL